MLWSLWEDSQCDISSMSGGQFTYMAIGPVDMWNMPSLAQIFLGSAFSPRIPHILDIPLRCPLDLAICQLFGIGHPCEPLGESWYITRTPDFTSHSVEERLIRHTDLVSGMNLPLYSPFHDLSFFYTYFGRGMRTRKVKRMDVLKLLTSIRPSSFNQGLQINTDNGTILWEKGMEEYLRGLDTKVIPSTSDAISFYERLMNHSWRRGKGGEKDQVTQVCRILVSAVFRSRGILPRLILCELILLLDGAHPEVSQRIQPMLRDLQYIPYARALLALSILVNPSLSGKRIPEEWWEAHRHITLALEAGESKALAPLEYLSYVFAHWTREKNMEEGLWDDFWQYARRPGCPWSIVFQGDKSGRLDKPPLHSNLGGSVWTGYYKSFADLPTFGKKREDQGKILKEDSEPTEWKSALKELTTIMNQAEEGMKEDGSDDGDRRLWQQRRVKQAWRDLIGRHAKYLRRVEMNAMSILHGSKDGGKDEERAARLLGRWNREDTGFPWTRASKYLLAYFYICLSFRHPFTALSSDGAPSSRDQARGKRLLQEADTDQDAKVDSYTKGIGHFVHAVLLSRRDTNSRTMKMRKLIHKHLNQAFLSGFPLARAYLREISSRLISPKLERSKAFALLKEDTLVHHGPSCLYIASILPISSESARWSRYAISAGKVSGNLLLGRYLIQQAEFMQDQAMIHQAMLHYQLAFWANPTPEISIEIAHTFKPEWTVPLRWRLLHLIYAAHGGSKSAFALIKSIYPVRQRPTEDRFAMIFFIWYLVKRHQKLALKLIEGLISLHPPGYSHTGDTLTSMKDVSIPDYVVLGYDEFYRQQTQRFGSSVDMGVLMIKGAVQFFTRPLPD